MNKERSKAKGNKPLYLKTYKVSLKLLVDPLVV